MFCDWPRKRNDTSRLCQCVLAYYWNWNFALSVNKIEMMKKEKTFQNLCGVVVWCFTLIEISHAAFKLEERYSWNQLDFVFPTRAMKGSDHFDRFQWFKCPQKEKKWKHINVYCFLVSLCKKDIALASGTYIPQNALPVGVEHYGTRLFVTVPRWKDGKIHFFFLIHFKCILSIQLRLK